MIQPKATGKWQAWKSPHDGAWCIVDPRGSVHDECISERGAHDLARKFNMEMRAKEAGKTVRELYGDMT